jgi:hypothetical protein
VTTKLSSECSDLVRYLHIMNLTVTDTLNPDSGLPRNFFLGGRGGGSTNSVEERGQRELGSGGGSLLARGSANLQMGETRILIRLLRIYFPRNREFGSVLSKLRNFGGGGG